MEKTIRFPLTKQSSTPIVAMHRIVRKWQCRNYDHQALTQKTVLVMEDILQGFQLKKRFYDQDNIEVKISTSCGVHFSVVKVFNHIEENIILTLSKDAEFGQQIFSVVFKNENGKILGVHYMTKGFCFESTFNELDSSTLNPEVLVELLLNRSKLLTGEITQFITGERKLEKGHASEKDHARPRF